MITKKSKVFIAGHNGMIGSAVLRLLKKKKFKKIFIKDRNDLDPKDQNLTQ